jgi:hypothetical protein
MAHRILLTIAFLLGVGLAPLLGQQLSPQVLQLLTRNNEWTGLQTFDRAVGLALESGTVPPATTTGRLYNVGGNLFWNGALVTTASGVGTVTSVGLSLPGIFSVSGSPVTSAGTLTATFATQTANTVFAGPTAGAAATPTFRALVAADLPPISATGLTGLVPVANGGTGLASGTSGGVLGYTATGTIASSIALTANQIVLGGGAGATPVPLGSLGTATTVLHGNGSGAPTFGPVTLTTDVAGILPVANGGLGIASGTSGGIPYFSGAAAIASSAALTQHALVVGGGAGAAPTVVGSLGTTTTVLHGNAAGAPTFGAVSLTADVSGVLPIVSGGTSFSTYAQGDLLYASATDTLAKLVKSATATRYLANTGASNGPAWDQVNLANGVTGTLPAANGGTSITTTPTNGQLLIGNGTGYTLATLTGTADQITVTNGAGSITLSTPQSLATTSTPQFARIGLGTGAGATAVVTTTGQFNLGLFDDGSCGAADTVDWNAGQIHKSTLTAATCTYTFSNPIAGATYKFLVAQDATGGRLVSWPASVVWTGGAAPVLSATPLATDWCEFLYDGTNYYGTCAIAVGGQILTQTTILTNAQILALRATPITVVTAPGANRKIVLVGAILRLNNAAGAYTETADNLALRYVDAAGVIASEAIETTGWVDGTTSPDTNALPKADTIATAAESINQVLVLHNTGGDELGGGNAANTLTVTVYYIVR